MQNKFRKWWLITIMAITCFSCKSGSQVKWEEDMEINMYSGGGMFPESQTVIIKNGTGKYIHWHQSKTDTLSFTMSRQEMDALIKKINTTHFTNIESDDTGYITYDKPTESLSVKWGAKAHKVTVGASEAIRKGKTEDFYTLYNYILALAEKKTGQAEK